MSLNYRPSKTNRVPPTGSYMTDVPVSEVRISKSYPWSRFAVTAAGTAAAGLIFGAVEVALDFQAYTSISAMNLDIAFDPAAVFQILSLASFILAVIFGALSLPQRGKDQRGRGWGITGLVVGIVGLVLLMLWSDGYFLLLDW